MKYRRTVFKTDGTKHVEEVELSGEEVLIRCGTPLPEGAYRLINGWNVVAARALHGPFYVYTVVETGE